MTDTIIFDGVWLGGVFPVVNETVVDLTTTEAQNWWEEGSRTEKELMKEKKEYLHSFLQTSHQNLFNIE